MPFMINFQVNLKDENKKPQIILDRYLEMDKAEMLFSETQKKFSHYSVEPTKRNQPFIYISTTPVVSGKVQGVMAGYRGIACFKTEVREQIIDFIKQIEKP